MAALHAKIKQLRGVASHSRSCTCCRCGKAGGQGGGEPSAGQGEGAVDSNGRRCMSHAPQRLARLPCDESTDLSSLPFLCLGVQAAREQPACRSCANHAVVVLQICSSRECHAVGHHAAIPVLSKRPEQLRSDQHSRARTVPRSESRAAQLRCVRPGQTRPTPLGHRPAVDVLPPILAGPAHRRGSGQDPPARLLPAAAPAALAGSAPLDHAHARQSRVHSALDDAGGFCGSSGRRGG